MSCVCKNWLVTVIYYSIAVFIATNIFPSSGGTTPEVQRTLRGSPCGVRGYKPPEGSPEGVPFSEASSRAKRSDRRAKRGSTERSEAVPPSKARLHRGSAERSEAARRSSGGRHYKKTQKGSTRKPRVNHLFFFFPKKTRVVKAITAKFLPPRKSKKKQKFGRKSGSPEVRKSGKSEVGSLEKSTF